MISVKNELQKIIKQRRESKFSVSTLKKLFFVLIFLSLSGFGLTKAYLFNQKTVSASFTAGTWESDSPKEANYINTLTPEAVIETFGTPEPTATPTETPFATPTESATETPFITPEPTPAIETPLPTVEPTPISEL